MTGTRCKWQITIGHVKGKQVTGELHFQLFQSERQKKSLHVNLACVTNVVYGVIYSTSYCLTLKGLSNTNSY